MTSPTLPKCASLAAKFVAKSPLVPTLSLTSDFTRLSPRCTPLVFSPSPVSPLRKVAVRKCLSTGYVLNKNCQPVSPLRSQTDSDYLNVPNTKITTPLCRKPRDHRLFCFSPGSRLIDRYNQTINESLDESPSVAMLPYLEVRVYTCHTVIV